MVSHLRYSAQMQEIKTAMALIVRAKLRVLGLITAEEVHRVKVTYQAAWARQGHEETWFWSLSDIPFIVPRGPEHKNANKGRV